MDHLIPNPAFYNIPFELKNYKEMPYRSLGRSGLKVSNVGLGTWKMGYPETGDSSRIDAKKSLAILDKSLDLGVTFWDTANRYNNASGNSERIIGSWFKDNPTQRRNVVLATKLSGGMDGLTPNHSGLSRGNIMESVYASLKRLQTDQIDLLYFHSFDPSTPVEESLMAIEDIVKQDLVRYFAVSNFTVEQLKAYQVYEEKLSCRSRIVAVQNQFDILNGEDAKYEGVMKLAEKTGVSFVAWSPIAKGLLTEKYLNPTVAGSGDRLFDEGIMNQAIDEHIMRKLHKLADIAAELNISISQLVIAYMLTLPAMGPVIPSSSTVEQLEMNAKAGSLILSDDLRQSVVECLG